MRRNRLSLFFILWQALCCATALAAQRPPLEAALAAPSAVIRGAELRLEALIVNPGEEPATFVYELRPAGLKIDQKSQAKLKNRVWLAAKAFLAVLWRAKAEAEGDAKPTLSLNGREAAAATVTVSAPKKAPALAKVHALSRGPLTVRVPQANRAYDIELEVTCGAAGELRATLERLHGLGGLSPEALVARGLVPPALGEPAKTPELALLYALQDASGGWGATPLAVPDIRTTSWVVFWLGHLTKAGVEIDLRVLSAAVGTMRKTLSRASAEMPARVLPALAAHGKVAKSDVAAVRKAGVDKLSTLGRLLAAYGSTEIPLPPRAKWTELNVREMSVLIATCVVRKHTEHIAALLPELVIRRGAQPGFHGHEAPLYAAGAQGAFGVEKGEPTAAVAVTLNGQPIKQVSTGPGRPCVRSSFAVKAPAANGKLEIRLVRETEREVFCRVVVRPAE